MIWQTRWKGLPVVKGSPLAVVDVRILFAVASFGESGDWIEGTLAVRSDEEACKTFGLNYGVNNRTVVQLFEQREHHTRMMRTRFEGDVDPTSDLRRGADLQSMQAGLAALAKSFDNGRR